MRCWSTISGPRRAALALPLQAVTPAARPRVVFPGAFHPLHEGHLAMARLAAQRLQAPVAWEISITNVDKPPLDFHEMRRRSAQFAAVDKGAPAMPLWFTRAPTFVAKSSIFPGATFVVGADTIDRIAHPRYYRGDPQARRGDRVDRRGRLSLSGLRPQGGRSLRDARRFVTSGKAARDLRRGYGRGLSRRYFVDRTAASVRWR